MVSNIWIENDLKSEALKVFKRRNLDLIPSTCNEKEGICLVSLSEEEITKIVSHLHSIKSLQNSLKVDSTGFITAQLKGTDILLDVISVHKTTGGLP